MLDGFKSFFFLMLLVLQFCSFLFTFTYQHYSVDFLFYKISQVIDFAQNDNIIYYCQGNNKKLVKF